MIAMVVFNEDSPTPVTEDEVNDLFKGIDGDNSG